MTAKNRPKDAPRRNFYGRRHGQTMNRILHDYLETDLAGLSPGPVSIDENPDRNPLNLADRFGDRPVWLEIGFGSGEHLAHQAGLHPDVAFIGCEPFVNGVATLLGKLRRNELTNVAVYPDDVRDLFDVLPDRSIDRAFLLYPDPWPKKRHNRRRFVTSGYLTQLARVLRPGAEFRVATDIADYVRQTLEQVPASGFAWQAENANDWRQPWSDWVSTRYEQKALREGRRPHYLTFLRT